MTTVARVRTGLVIGVAMSLISFGGVAAAQSSDSINNTGPDSTNVITHDNSTSCDVDNNTNVDVNNNNPQNSGSGDVNNSGNTSSGSSNSGNAGNNSNTDVNTDVNNSGCCNCAANQNQPEEPGRGGEVQAAVTPQVQTPAGGVSAGAGGVGSLMSLLGISLVSAAWGVLRVRKGLKGNA